MQQITALILRSLVMMDVTGKQRLFCTVFVGWFHLAKAFESVCATKQKKKATFLSFIILMAFIMAKFSTQRSGLFKFPAECLWRSLMPLKQSLLSPVA